MYKNDNSGFLMFGGPSLRFVLFENTVDSRYLDPSYLDPIFYVELISKSRLFSLYIYCISASRMSNSFMLTLWISRPSFSVPEYIFHSFYYRVSRTQTLTKENKM